MLNLLYGHNKAVVSKEVASPGPLCLRNWIRLPPPGLIRVPFDTESYTHTPLKIDLPKIDAPENRSGRQPKNCNFHILAPFQPFDLKIRLQGFLDPRIFSRMVPGPLISLQRPKIPKMMFYLPPGGPGAPQRALGDIPPLAWPLGSLGSWQDSLEIFSS